MVWLEFGLNQILNYFSEKECDCKLKKKKKIISNHIKHTLFAILNVNKMENSGLQNQISIIVVTEKSAVNLI